MNFYKTKNFKISEKQENDGRTNFRQFRKTRLNLDHPQLLSDADYLKLIRRFTTADKSCECVALSSFQHDPFRKKGLPNPLLVQKSRDKDFDPRRKLKKAR